ncbi:MAG: hypothetical protein V3T72_23120 [Thermoanaerobaculia bacterium]
MSRDGNKISRRDLLWGAAGAAVTGSTVLLWKAMDAPSASSRSRSAKTVEKLADSAAASAAVLGSKYLEQVPDEHDQRNLVRLLEERLAGSTQESLLARSRECIQRDYRDGEVVVVDGWQLSRTEARFYALASLR